MDFKTQALSPDPNALSQNPFDPRQVHTPFAGRAAAFARLHQHITASPHSHAFLILGEARIGKTALLQNFSRVFDPAQHIPVLLSLKSPPLRAALRDEITWLRALYQAILEALLAAGYSEERLPTLPLRHDNWRAWLKEIALPKVVQVLRVRRLVLLLDDADALLDAKRLPLDFPLYLQSLLQAHATLSIVMTLNNTHETQLEKLRPLVSGIEGDPEAYRLGMLSVDELKAIFSQADDIQAAQVTQAIYQATGGHPALVQRFGYHLWERLGSWAFTPDDVQAVMNTVYTDSHALYADTWTTFSLNEKWVLTALISLIYADPLRHVSAVEIEQWLVETDYHPDMTAIHAALRALEYRQVLTNFGGKVTISASLLQKWLLENARLESLPRASAGVFGALSAPRQHPFLWVALFMAAALLVLILLALSSNSSVPALPPNALPPTVTLAR